MSKLVRVLFTLVPMSEEDFEGFGWQRTGMEGPTFSPTPDIGHDAVDHASPSLSWASELRALGAIAYRWTSQIYRVIEDVGGEVEIIASEFPGALDETVPEIVAPKDYLWVGHRVVDSYKERVSAVLTQAEQALWASHIAYGFHWAEKRYGSPATASFLYNEIGKKSSQAARQLSWVDDDDAYRFKLRVEFDPQRGDVRATTIHRNGKECQV